MPIDIEWVDSFDSYGSSTSAGDLETEAYAVLSAGGGVSFVTGRTGNGIALAAGGGSTAYVERLLSGAVSRVFMAFGWNLSAMSRRLIEFYDGTTLQAYIVANATTYELFRGDGTSQGTIASTHSANTWYHVEFDISFNDTTGALTLYHNGALLGSLTSKDTNNGGGSQITKFRLGSSNTSNFNTHRYDDFIVQKPTGQFPIGPQSIYYLAPNGAGSVNDMATNAGAGSSTNYEKVDESPANADTDYVQSATPGVRDLYAMANLTPTEGKVAAVVARSQTKLDTAGTQQLKHILKTGGTEFDGAARSVTVAYTDYETTWLTNPDTGQPWTIAEVNALEAGVKVA